MPNGRRAGRALARVLPRRPVSNAAANWVPAVGAIASLEAWLSPLRKSGRRREPHAAPDGLSPDAADATRICRPPRNGLILLVGPEGGFTGKKPRRRSVRILCRGGWGGGCWVPKFGGLASGGGGQGGGGHFRGDSMFLNQLSWATRSTTKTFQKEVPCPAYAAAP